MVTNVGKYGATIF